MDISTYRSEIKDLIRQINKERDADSDKVIPLCDRLEKYGADVQDDALIGFASFTRGEVCYRRNDIIGFYREMLKCMEPLENIGEWGYLAMADNMLGIMSLNRGNAPFALDYYYKASRICERYALPDIEWAVRMNMGALYLSIENYDEAIDCYDTAYGYIIEHGDMDGYRQSLTQAAVGLSRAYLLNGDMENAGKYEDILENQCLPYLSGDGELSVYCYLSRYYNMTMDTEAKRRAIHHVTEVFSENIPIMDYFDDLYDFLSLLLETQDYSTFAGLIDPINALAKKAAVRHMEQKLLELLIFYYKQTGDQNSYSQACVRYYEISQLMDQENRMMIKNMIKLRENLYRLTRENEEIVKESKTYELRSETDPLTGMYNRLKLNTYGNEAFERAANNKTGLAVEILDIDFFKEYNDNYGHQAGDRVIRFIAESIRTLQKDNQIFAARYGGDEFVLIYETYTAEEVFELTKRLKQIINRARVVHEYSKTSSKFVTVSQGAFWGIPEAGGSVWHYLHEADRLLYRVKARTRNSILVGRKPEFDSSDITYREDDILALSDENSNV